jgi:hypothetical protein
MESSQQEVLKYKTPPLFAWVIAKDRTAKSPSRKSSAVDQVTHLQSHSRDLIGWRQEECPKREMFRATDRHPVAKALRVLDSWHFKENGGSVRVAFKFWFGGFQSCDLLIRFAQREEDLQSQPESSTFVIDGDHGLTPLSVSHLSLAQ